MGSGPPISIRILLTMGGSTVFDATLACWFFCTLPLRWVEMGVGTCPLWEGMREGEGEGVVGHP